MADEPEKPREAPAVAEARRQRLIAAALIGGGAAIATAGVIWGTRALAKRNREAEGKPISAIMETAITATELKANQPEEKAKKPS